MIQDTLSKHQAPALTSDQWHVVHAQWDGLIGAEPHFSRTIVSEHADRSKARKAAEELLHQVASQMKLRALEQRDQIFVRRPDFKSLKHAKRTIRRK